MKCCKCGAEIDNDSMFCRECGAKQNGGYGGGTPENTGSSFSGSFGNMNSGRLEHQPQSGGYNQNSAYVKQTKEKKNPRGMLVNFFAILGAFAIFSMLRSFIVPEEETSYQVDSGAEVSAEREPQSDDANGLESRSEGNNDVSEPASQPKADAQGDIIKNHHWEEEGGIIFYDSSEEPLFDDDVVILTDRELRLAGYEIYARHGLIFDDPDIRAYYSRYDWYEERVKTEDFSDSMLNDIELQNLDIIVGQIEYRKENRKVSETESLSEEGNQYGNSQDSYLEDEPGIIFSGSSKYYISQSELDMLSDNEIRMAINEIYARNGYIFNDPDIRAYYERYDWYEERVKPENFSINKLNDIERINLVSLEEERDSRK